MKTHSHDQKLIPISISSKKNLYAKPEKLFAPYKISWDKNDTHKHNEENTNDSSKAFFNAMKNQLMNIKSDVEKLIKDQTKKNERKLPDENHGISSINQQEKITIERIQTEKEWKKDKKISLSKSSRNIDLKKVKKGQEQTPSKEENIMKQKQEKIRKLESMLDSAHKELQIQKRLILEQEKQCRILTQEIKSLKSTQKQQNPDSAEQFANIKQSLLKVEQANLEYQATIKQKDEQIRSLKILMETHKSRNHDLEQIQSKLMAQERELLNQKSSIIQKQNIFREQLVRITKQYEDLLNQEHNQNYGHLQKMEEKVAELEAIIDQYVARIKELEEEQSNSEIQAKIDAYQNKIQQLLKDNQRHKSKEHRDIGVKDMKILGSEFQDKINLYIDENIMLKNKVSDLTAQLESIAVQKKFLVETIHVLQGSNINRNTVKPKEESESSRKQTELKQLLSAKQEQIQKLQFKIMELQNVIDSQKCSDSKVRTQFPQNSNQIINKVLKQQLEQNQNFRQSIKGYKLEIYNLTATVKWLESINAQLKSDMKVKNQEIQKIIKNKSLNKSLEDQSDKISELKIQLQLSHRKQETLQSLLQSKKQQIRVKDKFIKHNIKQSKILQPS